MNKEEKHLLVSQELRCRLKHIAGLCFALSIDITNSDEFADDLQLCVNNMNEELAKLRNEKQKLSSRLQFLKEKLAKMETKNNENKTC